MAAKNGLSARQEAFVREYLVDLNATAAYKRAGYRPKTDAVAAAAASQLLRVPKVASAVAAAQKERCSRTLADADRVVLELARVAFSDVGDILDFGKDVPALRKAGEIPEAARRAISSVKVRRVVEGSGEQAREVEITEFKLWDKGAALANLARHLGMFTDKLQVGGTGKNGEILVDSTSNLTPRDIAEAVLLASAAGLEVQRDGGAEPVDPAKGSAPQTETIPLPE